MISLLTACGNAKNDFQQLFRSNGGLKQCLNTKPAYNSVFRVDIEEKCS